MNANSIGVKLTNEVHNIMNKIIIIGGGISGLSAGVYGLLSGFEVSIYEKNALPGGECTGWNRKGYHIDNCIHWLTGTRKDTELYEVWNKVGALGDFVEYAKLKSFYSSTYKGQKATLWSDLDRTHKELIQLAPEDEDEITKFIQYVEYSKQCLFPAKKPMEMWGIGDYIQMGKNMADFPKVMKEFGKISLEEYSKRFKNPLLQKLMCDYLPKSYCAYSFLVSYATIVDGNGDIPMGGSLNMSLRMEKKFKELGGKINYNSEVQSIIIENKKAVAIRLDDGTKIDADYIIPAIDTKVLFGKLLPERYLPKELEKAYDNPTEYPATSGFQIAFSVPTSFGYGETVFIDMEPLKVGSGYYDRMYVKTYGYDPIYIKGDRCVIQTCITQTDDDFEYWESLSREEYNMLKKELVESVTRRIETHFPELAGAVEFLDAWTPLTYARYCNAYHGSYMSFVTTPRGKQIKMKGTVKGIKNMYIAGQWTNSPGGLPVAVASGKFTIQRILKKQKRSIDI